MTEVGTADEAPAGQSALGRLAWTWRDVQQGRLAAEQRGGLVATEIAPRLKETEDMLGRLTVRELKRHPVWPWLSQFPGLRGIHVARLIALIDDPRRFPGQRCTEGHTAPAIHAIGAPCPRSGEYGECTGLMQSPRRGTGVRSLWHYLGLHVVDGRSPRKAKGHKADWNPIGRTIVLMPDGIADHIVRSRTPVYRDLYDGAKLRLQERAVMTFATERLDGDVPALRPAAADRPRVNGSRPGDSGPEAADHRGAGGVAEAGGLKPFQIDALARKIAAKAFVADMLIEWKRLFADSPIADETPLGEGRSHEAAA